MNFTCASTQRYPARSAYGRAASLREAALPFFYRRSAAMTHSPFPTAARWGAALATMAALAGCVVPPVESEGRYRHETVVYTRYGYPPPPRIEHRPHPPGPNHMWEQGSWVWSGQRYQWRPGRWTMLHPAPPPPRPPVVRPPMHAVPPPTVHPRPEPPRPPVIRPQPRPPVAHERPHHLAPRPGVRPRPGAEERPQARPPRHQLDRQRDPSRNGDRQRG